MSTYLQNFLKYRPLLAELTMRDIKTRYRRSVMGVLWSLLNPLCTMIVLSIVFSNLFKMDIENFPLYILSGQVIFNFFSEATTNAMNAIIGSASLLKKAYMPKYLFVLSRVTRDLKVIDLTTIPEQSFWVKNWQENQFLHHFNENITKRVDPKDTNHLQYIPTQVFTEFLRYMFRDDKGQQVDGLIYGSSKTKEKNIVLFCNQKESEKFVDKKVKIEKFERTVNWKALE